MEKKLTVYQSVITDIKNIINAGQQEAYGAASKAMVITYWNVGKRIVEQEQAGKEHAEYGKKLLAALSDELTKEYGNGYSERNLRYFRKFYQYFPDEKIWNACVPNLNWTQFRSLLRVPDETARLWYMTEAANEGWSSRTLDRNISTQYYDRLLKSPAKENVIAEMKEKTSDYQKNSFELLKNPIMAEFLGFKNEDSYLESDLEAAIISHIRDFLMEMGRGFAFVARQQHIVTETEDYYIDLVFYNIELKCYVLIDLKRNEVQHEDIGQMNFYLNYFCNEVCTDGDNAPIGIVLGATADKMTMEYAMGSISNQLFVSRYQLYLPDRKLFEDELWRIMKKQELEKEEREDERYE